MVNQNVWTSFLAELEKIAVITPQGLMRVMKAAKKPVVKAVEGGAEAAGKTLGRMDLPGTPKAPQGMNIAEMLRNRFANAPARNFQAVALK